MIEYTPSFNDQDHKAMEYINSQTITEQFSLCGNFMVGTEIKSKLCEGMNEEKISLKTLQSIRQ